MLRKGDDYKPKEPSDPHLASASNVSSCSRVRSLNRPPGSYQNGNTFLYERI